ncbi:hypothetical protein [Megasphaera elsdenii]|uniref:hypothetical protein n=1 Tax=Megasphaera elsdenii TaxID=907 RepID=UPI002A81AC47|nr:hypothetical protein [Megasphaera elsdenii]MDY4265365.1 hypothetical protein [Megasphaera elsdenii]
MFDDDSLDAESLTLCRRLSRDGQRREDQDRLIRMPVHLVCPSQLHERFAEAAVSKDSRAPLS